MTDAKMLEALKAMLLGMRACPDTDFLRHMRPAMTKAEAAVKEAETREHDAPTPGVYFHGTV